ncbi:putative phage tail assembly chaperone [Zooshikella ganghwensis]|uniref:Phage protein n=1 Tax=Zooshikella ganghwensis TaxID=202772 RepID=A0A4P9VGI5_9GAMM|nr:putative phage tail assembly chaperone [Zooshikella ganghwensis]RDH41197.1 hypothetical protein B9G39_29800 [Zooshikella ganghwensis]
MSEQKYTLTINDQELTFVITVENFNYFVGGVNQKNKLSMAHNFCMQTVVENDKDALKALLKLPSVSIQIAEALIEAYVPQVNIMVKPVPTTASN